MSENKEKILLFSLTAKDFRFDFFAAATKGGQHANRKHTNCRCVHIESGAIGISTDQRSQTENKEMAFTRCCESEKFKKWHRGGCARRLEVLGHTQVELEYEKLSGARADKIRTYDFKKNTVINHLTGTKFFNLDEILNGRLDELIEDSQKILRNE